MFKVEEKNICSSHSIERNKIVLRESSLLTFVLVPNRKIVVNVSLAYTTNGTVLKQERALRSYNGL